jgi:poly(A) polymerase
MIFPRHTESLDLLRSVARFAGLKKIKLFIVGGILRDSFVRRTKEHPDFDFCLKKGSIAFGRELARRLKAGFVVLDKERGYCRLVKRIKDTGFTLDFTDFRGATLEDDLRSRDFTVNAMALPIAEVFTPEAMRSLIDPWEGLSDIRKRRIRITHKDNFKEDPLRILRAFSLSATFGFTIEKQTVSLMKRFKDKLSGVSPERVRDELFKILDVPGAYQHLVAMDDLKILKLIIPEIEVMRGVRQGPYHHLDVLKHSFETVRQLELLFEELKRNKEIAAYLDERVSADRKRRSLMKLASLLHDIGKPAALRRKKGKTIFHGHERIGSNICEEIIKRLKLSNDELTALRKMVFWHLRPGYLADNVEVSRRAKFRYFRDTGSEGASVLLVSIADQRSTRGPLTSEKDRIRHEKICLSLIKEYFRKAKEAAPARLINGDALMKKLKLTPSPLVGKILSELEELQAIGKIKTRQQALLAAGKIKRKLEAF